MLKCCQLSVIPNFVCLLALIFHYGKYLHYFQSPTPSYSL